MSAVAVAAATVIAVVAVVVVVQQLAGCWSALLGEPALQVIHYARHARRQAADLRAGPIGVHMY